MAQVAQLFNINYTNTYIYIYINAIYVCNAKVATCAMCKKKA